MMLPPSHPHFGRASSLSRDLAKGNTTRFAVLATCTSADSMTIEVYRGKNGWQAFASWLDRHGYDGYTGVGRRSPGPPPHAEIDLYSGGELMERVLVVPAAALEGCPS